MKNLKNLIDKIKKGEIKMRPKWHFVLKTLLIILSIIAASLFILYLTSFIFFTLRLSGVWYLPKFGFRGMGPLFFSLPWFLLLSAALLIVVLEILVRRFSFVYRRPILYTVLGVILLVLLGGFLINKTSMHPALFQRADRGRLPIMGSMYRGYGMPDLEDVHRGIVSEITDEGFVFQSQDNRLFTVITSGSRFSREQEIQKDNAVIVLGKAEDGVIKAAGVRVIDDDFRSFMRNGAPRMPMSPVRR